MDYSTFIQAVKEQLYSRFSEGTTIDVNQIHKNNGVVLDALTIHEPNVSVSPALYLNYYYQYYEKHGDLKQIIDELYHTYKNTEVDPSFSMDFFTKFEKAKEAIVFRLVNYDKNSKLLDQVPHIPYLDLAIVFCVLAPIGSQNGSVLIYHTHLNHWKITPEELKQVAFQNTPKLLPFEFKDMGDIMNEFLADMNLEFHETMPPIPDYPMYILTNSHRFYGATCMLYPDVLANLSKQLGGDLFILPSSIHELILIPANISMESHQLNAMVNEVNDTQLEATEILSNHVYYYSQKEGRITSSSYESMS